MNLLYNSDHFAVLQLDWAAPAEAVTPPDEQAAPTLRGGYEIVDKRHRRGIFLEGVVAAQFRAGVEALVEQQPEVDAMDDYLSHFTDLASQAWRLH